MSDLSWVSSRASGILIPSGYKAGTLYGIVPDNQYTTGIPKNAFDFTFARTSIATRTNEAGAWETMANDVPRLQYPSCPSCLLEPARTNLFLNSDIGVTQTITVVSGSVYSMAFYEGAGSIELTGAHTATLKASDHAYSGAITFTATTTSLVCTVTGAANLVQCELGTYPTTYIKTEAAAANRAVDDMSLSGLQTNGILGATEGTWYVQFDRFDGASSSSAMRFGLRGTTDLGFGLSGSNINIRCNTKNDNLNISMSNTKICLRYTPTGLTMYLNGSAQALPNCGSEVYTSPTNFITLVTPTLYEVKEMAMFPNTLTDAQMIELTT